jgi:hypothetical protein
MDIQFGPGRRRNVKVLPARPIYDARLLSKQSGNLAETMAQIDAGLIA